MFVQNMESPQVREKVGNHIASYVNDPEPELRESIHAGKDTGILRAEITFYMANRRDPIPKEHFIDELEKHLLRIDPRLLYHNTIKNQSDLLCNAINHDLCLVEITKKLAFINIYVNKLTGKTNGSYWTS